MTVPMPSARVAAGTYHVLGTSKEVIVQRVLDPDRPGAQLGWHLIVEGEWAQTYRTKREALQACQRDPSL